MSQTRTLPIPEPFPTLAETRAVVHIASVSAVLPGTDIAGAVLSNEQLSALMGDACAAVHAETGVERLPSTVEFPLERIGIESRRLLDESLTARDMALQAGRVALERAGIDRATVRVLIVASVTPDRVVPSMAACLQRDLGLPNDLVAFDLPQGCCGFVTALHLAERLLKTEDEGSTALVVGSDAMSRVLDASDRDTCTIFGDGAGAVVLSRSSGMARLVATQCWTFGDGADRIEIRSEAGTAPLPRFTARDGEAVLARDEQSRNRVRMDGRAVYKDMVSKLPAHVSGFLSRNGLTPDDVSHFVFHQANRRLVEGIARNPSLAIESERLPFNIDTLGNTTSASIPILLAGLQGVEPGQYLLCTAFGTGYALGMALLRWE